MSGRINDIIKKSGLIPKADLEKALEFSERDGIPLSLFLLKNNLVKEDALLKAVAASIGSIGVVDLDKVSIDEATIQCIPRDLALQHRVVPLKKLGNSLLVCSADPSDLANLDALSAKIGLRLRMKLAGDLGIERALHKYYVSRVEDKSRRATKAQVIDENSEGYVVSYIDRLMQFAVRQRASDIHIEPFERALRIRVRIDGALVEYKDKARFEMRDSLTTRVKIISGLDIAEKRLPQDGNCKIEVAGSRQVDFRVSTLPTVWGEKIVLRLLDKSNLQLDLTKLGFEIEQLNIFREAITRSFGMVIVTGPTGSGKTTTLYSALNELNRLSDNVVTVEDPVEYTIPGIAQVNIRSDIGFNFATALKAFLRQDPDVIMVGEIRDSETAEIAMRAALTGHIVLSTLHTNNAPETLERLRNMGVEPFTIISALNCVVAQRLMRKLCKACKKESSISPNEQISLGLPAKYVGKFPIYKEVGCTVCNFTGFSGRTAIYEVMPLTDSLKRSVAEGQNSAELKRIAISEGMQTLRQSAWKKVAQGVSSISELVTAGSSDKDPNYMSRKVS